MKPEFFIPCRPALAVALKSADKALIIESVIWSIADKKNKKFYDHCHHEGRWYMWDTYEQWHQKMPWLAQSTIRKYIASLRKDGWLLTANLAKDPRDRTLFYTVDQTKIDEAYMAFFAKSMCSTVADEAAQSEHISTATGVAAEASIGVADLLPINLTKNQTKTLTRKSSYTDFDYGMAKLWHNYAKSISPNGRFVEIKFAEAIMKMRTKFSMTEDQIEYMLKWIKDDEFWCNKAISPASLLKASKAMPEITKLEQIILAITARKKTKSEKVMESILATEAEVMDPNWKSPLEI